jgi:hypothetical protein
MIIGNFNYSKNLTAVLGQVLKPLGYKKKGNRFTLIQSYLTFSINFQRSSWNSLTDRPKEFSVDLEIESFDKGINISFPLNRLTKVPFPSYYGPFFLDKISWEEKTALMNSFTDIQILEIDRYRNSLNWYYDSEESLIQILNEVKEQLIKVALPTIDFVNDYLRKNPDSKNLYRMIRKKSEEFYLMQLEFTSRYPTD